jgi:hypothetical protein
MVQIRRPRDNSCAFEILSKMADLKFFFALMKKRQSFCYPTVQQNTINVVAWMSNAYPLNKPSTDSKIKR